MKKKNRFIIGILFIFSVFAFQVFANFYDTANIERIDETSFGGRIVKEAIFVYGWVQQYGAETDSMEKVTNAILDTNDQRKLYNNLSYIAEKYTGQKKQKIFVKDINSLDPFIDGQTSTLAHRCTLSDFECILLKNASFESGKEYYIKMSNDRPFYINFCKDSTSSYISGRGCVKTHKLCANDTARCRILAPDGVTQVTNSAPECFVQENFYEPDRDKCIAPGTICTEAKDSYDEDTAVCTKVVQITTGQVYTCKNNNFIGRKHIGFTYPKYVFDSKLDLAGDNALTFVSTGNRSEGNMYEWKGNGCKIDDYQNGNFNRFLCDSTSSEDYTSTESPVAKSTVYLSLRASCGAKVLNGTRVNYSMDERKATLTLQYREKE